MSRDERLAAAIQEAIRSSLEREPEDPQAIERVGVAVSAALGRPVDTAGRELLDEESQTRPGDRDVEG